MNFPYFGATVTNTTLTQTAGTRRELVDFIAAAAATAGWSYVSGSGTGTPKLKSALTPHGLRCRFSASDVADATSASFFPLTDPDEFAGGNHFCRVGVGLVWRVIASPYYIRAFVDSPTVSFRDIFLIENLWIPAPFRGTVTEACFSSANTFTGSGSDTQNRVSLRDRLHQWGAQSNYLCAYNGNRWQGNQGGFGGTMSVTVSVGANVGNGSVQFSAGSKWCDQSWNIEDAPVAWGLTSYTDNNCTQRGVLGDAILIGGSTLSYGNTVTIDGHTWFVTAAFNQGFNLCYLIA